MLKNKRKQIPVCPTPKKKLQKNTKNYKKTTKNYKNLQKNYKNLQKTNKPAKKKEVKKIGIV